MLKKVWILLVLLLGMLAAGGCDAFRNVQGISAINYYYTSTEDGVTLALRRYKPKNLDEKKAPVILCHGLSYNLLFWDLDDKASLARYLVREGYDVWSLSLRGASPSSQPLSSAFRRLSRFNIEPEVLKTLYKRMSDLAMTDWTVDQHIYQDVPAAIKFVRERTGQQKVHWVGHSMGGMVMFAYLQSKQNGVKSFVAVAVPMTAFHPLSDPMNLLVNSEGAIKIGSKVVGSSAPAGVGSIVGDLDTPFDKLFYNSKNVDLGVLQRLHHNAEEEISGGQLKQLIGMVRTEHFTSADGKLDYTAGMDQVTTPTLFIAGTVDSMATVGAVQWAYRMVESNEKQYLLFGRVNGYKADYGHDDLIIGKHAQQEVYPKIVEWLQRYPATQDDGGLLLQPGKDKNN